MNTLTETRNSPDDLHKRIQAHLEMLSQATDKASKSKEMLRYLNFVSKFHAYSPANIWLIMFSRPDATLVAGFNKWKVLNRWVRAGEKAIPILAPLLVKQQDEDGVEVKRLVGFKTVYVFDVSQTSGEPLPPMPDWKSPQKNEELNRKLIHFAESQGISVAFKNLPGEMQGCSKGGAVEIDRNAGTKTLVHEIAHEFLHRVEKVQLSRAERELEAEAVAFVVGKHFGLGNLNSPNYLAFFGATSANIATHTERIRATANRIITAIEPQSFCD